MNNTRIRIRIKIKRAFGAVVAAVSLSLAGVFGGAAPASALTIGGGVCTWHAKTVVVRTPPPLIHDYFSMTCIGGGLPSEGPIEIYMHITTFSSTGRVTGDSGFLQCLYCFNLVGDSKTLVPLYTSYTVKVHTQVFLSNLDVWGAVDPHCHIGDYGHLMDCSFSWVHGGV